MTEIKAPIEGDVEHGEDKPNVLQMALLSNPG